ncbi:MAG: DHA2 family multidrug resistance protein [Gammaproteobacteria bacterium]
MNETASPYPETLSQRILILAAVVYPAALFVGTQTIANSVLPQMRGDFSASIEQISWVVTISVVAGAIAIPPIGWLARRYGRKRIFIISLIGFSAGSLIAGMVDSLAGLVLARCITALFGAPTVALSQAVMMDTFPPKERGAAFALWSVGILCGWIFAPAAGAYLAEVQSWRLIFFALVPFGLLGAFACTIIPKSSNTKTGEFDWPGFVALSVALGSFIVVLNRGVGLDWFDSREIVMWTALGSISLYLFIVHSWFSKKQLIRWKVFHDRNFAVGFILILGYAHMNLAPLVMIPAMLNDLRGVEMLTTGLVLIPRGIAQMVGMLLLWMVIDRLDQRLFIVLGFLLFAWSCWLMAGFNLSVSLADVVWANIVQGLAQSLIWLPVMNLTYMSLQAEFRTDATSLVSLVYSTSASAGVAVGIALLAYSTQVNHEELMQFVSPGNELFKYPEYSTSWDWTTRSGLLALAAEVKRQASMLAYVNVFYATMILTFLLTPLALLLRVRPPAPAVSKLTAECR